MSQLRAHRLLSTALRRLEQGSNRRSVMAAIKSSVEELKDPFAGEIDDFLAEKEAQKTKPEEAPADEVSETEDPNETFRDGGVPGADHPQDQAEDELDNETGGADEMPGDVAQEAPQDKLEDKVEEEAEETAEDKVEELEDQQEEIDEEIEKVEKQTPEDPIEASLRRIAILAKKRGYHSLANKFIKATTGGVVEILNNLLMKEYSQRDIAVNYYYLFDDAQKSYLIEHFNSEKERIVYLQNAIVELGGVPTTQRLSIPPVNPLSADAVIALNVEMEKQSVAEYLAAAQSLDGMMEYASLKTWLESIGREEEEDANEFERL